jgi:hypothetical protein
MLGTEKGSSVASHHAYWHNRCVGYPQQILMISGSASKQIQHTDDRFSFKCIENDDCDIEPVCMVLFLNSDIGYKLF